ncbi:hypothetical protein RRG08_000221 [Elysia crispata]|uniref:Uncharacterized protein n=1 Tax=Elysia crispata TaxID=231223 RepID=A0AAE1AWS1_9GAST|nr:hypothetical protein RRG08_000221 [Elysia crispata]
MLESGGGFTRFALPRVGREKTWVPGGRDLRLTLLKPCSKRVNLKSRAKLIVFDHVFHLGSCPSGSSPTGRWQIHCISPRTCLEDTLHCFAKRNDGHIHLPPRRGGTFSFPPTGEKEDACGVSSFCEAKLPRSGETPFGGLSTFPPEKKKGGVVPRANLKLPPSDPTAKLQPRFRRGQNPLGVCPGHGPTTEEFENIPFGNRGVGNMPRFARAVDHRGGEGFLPPPPKVYLLGNPTRVLSNPSEGRPVSHPRFPKGNLPRLMVAPRSLDRDRGKPFQWREGNLRPPQKSGGPPPREVLFNPPSLRSGRVSGDRESKVFLPPPRGGRRFPSPSTGKVCPDHGPTTEEQPSALAGCPSGIGGGFAPFAQGGACARHLRIGGEAPLHDPPVTASRRSGRRPQVPSPSGAPGEGGILYRDVTCGAISVEVDPAPGGG